MSGFYRRLWYNPICNNSINENVYVEVGLRSNSDCRGLSEMEARKYRVIMEVIEKRLKSGHFYFEKTDISIKFLHFKYIIEEDYFILQGGKYADEESCPFYAISRRVFSRINFEWEASSKKIFLQISPAAPPFLE